MASKPALPPNPPAIGPKPTMRHVALAAGVGVKTVSRVVNNEPGVSAEMATHVRNAIASLGFRRNNSARLLKQGVSESIGLVCGDVSEPFQSQLIRAVEEVAIQHNSMLIVASSANDPEREAGVVQALASRQVDGLILAPSGPSQAYLGPDVDAGLPIVFVDRPPRGMEGDVVLADNAGGIAKAVWHLAQQGHRRIAFIGDQVSLFSQRERMEAYRTALTVEQLPVDDTLIAMQAPSAEGISAALERVLVGPDAATAIITGNALSTFALLRALQQGPYRPALVGFDDFALADLMSPGVTVIAQDPSSIGRIAAELLFRRISGAKDPVQTIRLGTRLIQRGSGEAPPKA